MLRKFVSKIFLLSAETGDSATILDEGGNVKFKIDAKLMTMSARRVLLDASGTEIGSIRKKKTPGLHEAWYLGTPSDDKKCKVKATGCVLFLRWPYL